MKQLLNTAVTLGDWTCHIAVGKVRSVGSFTMIIVCQGLAEVYFRQGYQNSLPLLNSNDNATNEWRKWNCYKRLVEVSSYTIRRKISSVILPLKLWYDWHIALIALDKINSKCQNLFTNFFIYHCFRLDIKKLNSL